MTAPNDITWNQLQSAFSEIGITGIVNSMTADGIYRISLDLSEIVSIETINDPGVLKFVSKLLDACRIAQNNLNSDGNGGLKPTGERLDAFPAPTIGTISNGYAPITKSVKTRSDLSSVTRITGATA